jgi:CBS domain-containing protein
MICPNCGHYNLPGSEECSSCLQSLTPLDLPIATDQVERSLMEEPVEALCPREPITLGPTATIQEAIQTMLTHDIGALIVTDKDGRLMGIFSERDLLAKVAGLQPNYAELPIAQFMTPNPETVNPDSTLAEAINKMNVGGYRHLPVVTDGRPTGVVSVRDMLRHITAVMQK